jgi:glycosyltransferase involved in cell wall biosynthesis
MSVPKVSVIIPTYNRAHFLGEAISSVLGQTFCDFELIVVDDGSQDRTPEVVRSFKDPRIRYLRQENRGISAAMNAGLAAARGAYIGRLDSDDLWLPEFLEKTVEVLDRRPEIGAAYAISVEMDKNGKPLSGRRGYPPRFLGDDFSSMLYDDFTSSITVLARRACFDRAGGFDESLRASEDWDMCVRIARQFRFAFVDCVLARFRSHGGNTTAKRSKTFEAFLEGRVRVLDKVFESADVPPAARALKPVFYRNVHTMAALLWISAGEPGRSLRALARALRNGGNPAATLARFGYFALVWFFLNRFALGRRLVEWNARARRSFRLRRSARALSPEVSSSAKGP